MKNLGLRYKLMIFNIVLTVCYYGFIQIYSSVFLNSGNDFGTILNQVFDIYILVLNYNWINLIWIFLIIMGLIRKDKEMIVGGALSIFLSIAIFIVFMWNGLS